MNQSKTIKVETRCWWVTPTMIREVDVIEVVDINHFLIECNGNCISTPPYRVNVRMDELIPLPDRERVRRRMRTFIETGESQLKQFEKQFSESEPAVTLNETNRIPIEPEQEPDREIDVMRQIVDAFALLHSAERARVISWAKRRFDNESKLSNFTRLHPQT